METVEGIPRMTATHQIWGATCPHNSTNKVLDVFDCIEGEVFKSGRKF